MARSTFGLIFLAAVLGLALAAALGGMVFGISALLHHLSTQ
jgi:hypothetical protein